MDDSGQAQSIIIHQRGYYSVNFQPQHGDYSACYIQTVLKDEKYIKAQTKADELFGSIPVNSPITESKTSDEESFHRYIFLNGGTPLFKKLQEVKSISETKKIVLGLMDFLQQLESKRTYNTALSPFNLVFTNEENKVEYINLDCNAPRGKTTTPLYRAPEILGRLKTHHSLQADFYSVGIILYAHFLGGHPFSTFKDKKTRREQVVRNLKPLHKLVESFPVALSLIIAKLLHKQPDKRYQSVYGIRKDFEDFYADELINGETFTPGMYDFIDTNQIVVPETFIQDKYKILDNLLFETEERNHKVVFITGSQLNASDLLIRNYLSHHSKSNTLIASAHVKENAKYLPFYTASLVFKEIASWLIHSKIYKDERFIRFSKDTDSIIIETLVHICPELTILKSDKFRPIDQPISDTNILYTAVKQLFRFLGSITKPLIISLNNTEFIDKDSTKLFFEILSTADIPHLAFLFQTFSQTKRPKHFSNKNAIFTPIELWHLENNYIEDLLDSLTNGKIENKKGLAELLQERCLGKYELVKQFIIEMQANKSLTYDRQDALWKWSAESSQSIESPLTLEEICEKKQLIMSKSTVELLKQAALIGNVFNLHLLSKLSGQTKEQLFIRMEEAKKFNLVFELTQYSNFKTPENSIFFKFASDRAFRLYFKQGKYAYSDKYPEAFQQTVNYLLKRGNNKLLFEDFFASIQKFADQLTDEMRAHIVQVMISKIKDYIFLCKFNKAENLINLCFDLLPAHSWLHKYYLTKELYFTAFTLSHNTNTFEKTDSLFEEASQYLNTPEDHISFNLVYADSRMKRNEIDKARDILLKSAELSDTSLLKKLGIKDQVEQKVIFVFFRNRVLNNELSFNGSHSSSTENNTLAQINILAHKLDRDIYYSSLRIIIKDVFLNGLYDDFALPLLIYSKRLLDLRKHIKFALRLANFVIQNVSDKYTHYDQCQLYYYTNIHPFSERIQSSKQKIKTAIDQKVSLGDLTTAYDLSFDYIFRSLVEGEKLQNILNETLKIWRIKRKYSKQKLDFDLLTVFNDRIKALYDHQRVDDVTRNSERFERHAKLSFWNNLTLLIYFYNTDHFDKALICAGNAQLRSESIENNLPLIMLEFYYCLSLAEDFPNMTNYRKLEALHYIRMRHKELEKLSKHSKENFSHMALLLQGSIYRLSRRPSRAIPTIKKAAYTAEKYGNINIQAMCYKILAQVALDLNRDTDRRQYLIKAYNYYRKWGANTIAERIKLDNFQVFEEMNLRILNVI